VTALRVLQIGMGGWGRDWAWRVNPDVTEVEIVGYVDSDPAALDAVREESKIPRKPLFESIREATNATQPEAALVTTALPGHVPVTRAALEAGLHVLVEKPFAPTLAAAEEMVGLAAARQVTLMVSQNYRFFPAARAVARLVKEANLGRLHEVAIDFRRWSAAGPNGRGRHHMEEQPLLVDMSIHHFDLLRLILAREPKRIYCEAWNPEWTAFAGPSVSVASIVFDDDTVVSYRGSWVSAAPVTPWAGEWRMEFEGGEIFWSSRDDNGALLDRVVVRPRGGRTRTATLPEVTRADRWGTLTEFANAIREGREPETSGRDNLGTIALMEAAVESARTHQPVEIERVGTQLAI
jgi:predicted dehydrogenase